MVKSKYLTTPALLAIALSTTSAFAQDAEPSASPPPVAATVPEAAPPPIVRTVTDTVAPEAIEQVRQERAAQAATKPAPRTAVRSAATAPNAVATPAAPASEADTSSILPAAESEVLVPVETAPTPVAEEVGPLPADTGTDGSTTDWTIYGGIAAALGLAGIGAALAARRRRGRFSEDDRGAVEVATARAPAAPLAPAYVEPGRTRIIEPAAAPVAATPIPVHTIQAPADAVRRPVAEPVRDPLFARHTAVAEGVTDPLFTRPQAPPPPVTDPLFARKIDVPPVTDPMFASHPDYAGPARRQAPITPREKEEARTRDVEFAL